MEKKSTWVTPENTYDFSNDENAGTKQLRFY